MKIYDYFYYLCALFLLAGCSHNVPMSTITAVDGFKPSESVLIVNETFIDGYNELPAGEYYPYSATANGYMIYHFTKPIKVTAMWYKDICKGGLAVKADNPYKDYFISVINCFGDPNIKVGIPKEVDFTLKRKN